MDSTAIRESTPPLPFVVLNLLALFFVFLRHIEPKEFPLPMLFIVQELSNVQVAVLVDFHSWAMTLVVAELSLVEFAFLRDVDAPSHFFLLADFPEVYFARRFDEFELGGHEKVLEFEEVVVGEELVGGEEVAEFCLIHVPDFGE